jgi:hypothetical protein
MVLRKGGCTQNDLSFNIGNINIELVNQSKYLGINVTITGAFSQAISDLKARAQKACFKVWSILSSANLGNIATNFKLFYSMIRPILTYASEV